MQDLADRVLHKPHLADHVPLGDIDVRIRALGGVSLPDLIHVIRVVVVVLSRGGAAPEGRQVCHAQLKITIVDLAALLEKILARRWITQQVVVKLAHEVGNVLFNNQLALLDGGRVLLGKSHELRHVAEVVSRVVCGFSSTLHLFSHSPPFRSLEITLA